ncbi:Flp family type IVb pilin [Novosphingobium resinovorum]|nr:MULTISPECIES: Flp family type IVb pilin [Novosphingobium]AOR80064.1 pilus assembly protein [Novosphingobium resinovorum]MBF7014110.1 Flp family type IVb pilin [Novosphingobium sp. HR1a]WJM26251.1 Flp family type IVb pilin [Novosphingobium resinovorum]
MNSILNLVARLRTDERGLTAVEYAVLGGIVVAALVAVGTQFDTDLRGAFTSLFNQTPG